MNRRRSSANQNTKCAIEGCVAPSLTRGWCKRHYTRWWKYGDPMWATIGHGHKRGRRASDTYRVWVNMIARCKYTYLESFARYGGRGIRVCERWMQFSNFLADMGERPTGLTLDRIDNDGNYEPNNCRWAAPEEQRSNRSVSRRVIFNGQKTIAATIARAHGIDNKTFNRRLDRGLSPECAAALGPAARRS